MKTSQNFIYFTLEAISLRQGTKRGKIWYYQNFAMSSVYQMVYE